MGTPRDLICAPERICREGLRGPYEPCSKLLVSPLITPIVVPYIIPYITPSKEFRLWLIWDVKQVALPKTNMEPHV